MNWFRENRWLGTFLIVFGICTLLAVYFLFKAKGEFQEATARFHDAATERNRLEHLNPFPNEGNYQQMKTHLENYRVSLDRVKQELKTQVLPITPLAPNEFQSRLRQAIIATANRARTNRVKLPVNFRLGFDEFTAALPNTPAAPLLGQELAQIELLVNLLIDTRVDAVTALKRAPLPDEKGSTPAATPERKQASPAATGPKMLERGIVDLTFASSPSVARRVLNQIASTSEQFFIIRTLHVRNEQDKGPPREGAEAAAVATSGKPTPKGAIKFIVGNEHIETSARIELVRFTF